MRIVHVSDCYLPRTGGIETQVRGLALHQRDAGHLVQVITATAGHGAVRSGEDLVDDLRVHRIAARLPFELPIHPRTGHHVGAILDRERPDVVHVHVGAVSPFAWGAVRAAGERKLPVLVTVHSVWGPLARPAYGLSEAIVKWSGRGVQLSAVSSMAAHLVSSAVPSAGEVLVVPNGIDVDAWCIDERVPASNSEIRLVTVMRMAPRKRTGPLVRALATASRALAGQVVLTATLVGDGPQRLRAQRWVGEQGLGDAIVFTGRLDRGGIRDVFARSDAYLQPSVRESFGIAALEARAAGLPVVVRRESGSVQFIEDGVDGLVVSSDSGLVSAIVRLARDRELLDRISNHNRAVPPHETWPNVVADVELAYAAAIARVRRS